MINKSSGTIPLGSFKEFTHNIEPLRRSQRNHAAAANPTRIYGGRENRGYAASPGYAPAPEQLDVRKLQQSQRRQASTALKEIFPHHMLRMNLLK